MSKAILVMAAGTGGHVFPALAVADAMAGEGYDIHWLATPAGMENRLVPSHGFPLHAVSIRGLRGKGLMGLLAAPWRILKATWQSLAVIRRIRPVAVVGFGGYIAGPGGLAAKLAGVPLVIHEQNAFAGMTNRLLNRIATRSLQAFPGALDNAAVIGNPVRQELMAREADLPPQSGQLNVLVVGGSLGAVALNDVVLACWKNMPENTRPQLMHQVGQRDHERMLECYQQQGVEAEVVAFIDDMAAAYRKADLVICRSGALTVSELAACGKAAIFVPYPYAVDDHQTANAEYLQQAGAALICQQRDLTPQWLQQTIETLDQDRDRLRAMAAASFGKAMGEATSRAVNEIKRVARDA